MHSGNISSLYGDFNMFIGTDSVVNLFFTDKTVACLQINNADGSDVKIVYMADNDGNITGITVFLKTVCDVTA
jgi:hypothetical protein